MRSKIDPMKKVAKMVRSHRELILNWFEARGTISSGVVEGLNNKVKLTTRKSYGFRTENAVKLALYPTFRRSLREFPVDFRGGRRAVAVPANGSPVGPTWDF